MVFWENTSKVYTAVLSLLTLALIFFLSSFSITETGEMIRVEEGHAVFPSAAESDTMFALDGDWELTREGETTFQRVPAVAWHDGTGVYRLHLTIPSSLDGKAFQLYTKNIGTSADLFVNDVLIGSQGVWGASEGTAVPSARPVIYSFPLRGGENVLEVRVSNFTHPRAGLWERVVISRAPVLQQWFHKKIAGEFILIGMELFISVFIIVLAFQLRERSLFFFAAAVTSVALGSFVYNTFPIYELFPSVGYLTVKKGTFIFYYLSSAFIFKSICLDISPMKRSRFVQIMSTLYLVLAFLSVILPYRAVYLLGGIFTPTAIFVFIFFLFIQYRSVFTYPSHRSFYWNIPRIIIISAVLYGTAHDLYFYITGQYEESILHYLSAFYSVGYSLLLVRTILENRKRIEEAKSLMIQAADETRRGIRDNLHDGLGQLTHAMGFLIDGIKEQGVLEEHVMDRLQSTSRSINEELRYVIDNLAPSRLSRLGLKKAIEEMVERNRGIYGITIQCDITFDTIQGWTGVTEQIFLMVNEALNNALRHASPDFIRITLTKKEGVFSLQVRNNGVSPSGVIFKRVKGHGLDIMRYRIEQLGGVFDVHAEIGGMFTIFARIPEEQK